MKILVGLAEGKTRDVQLVAASKISSALKIKNRTTQKITDGSEKKEAYWNLWEYKPPFLKHILIKVSKKVDAACGHICLSVEKAVLYFTEGKLFLTR